MLMLGRPPAPTGAALVGGARRRRWGKEAANRGGRRVGPAAVEAHAAAHTCSWADAAARAPHQHIYYIRRRRRLSAAATAAANVGVGVLRGNCNAAAKAARGLAVNAGG